MYVNILIMGFLICFHPLPLPLAGLFHTYALPYAGIVIATNY